MTLSWRLLIAIFAIYIGFSEATTTIAATPTTTVAASTSTAAASNSTAAASTSTAAASTSTAAASTSTAAATTSTVAATTSTAAVSTSTVAATTSTAAVSTSTAAAATSTAAATTSTAAATTSTAAAATSTAAATTSTAAAATSTAAVQASSAAIPSSFYTYLKANFKSSECAAAKDTLLNSTFQGFYTKAVFDFMEISFIVERDTCVYNFTIKFGPNLQMYNISEVFEDELKSLSYTVGTLKLTDIKTEVYVAGVTLGVFKAGADDCKKICCDGAGGPITLSRTCSPSNLCRSYVLKKEEPDCTNVCSECSGVTMCKISLLVLLFGAFMNWFLK